jgi:hypothetical protein
MATPQGFPQEVDLGAMFVAQEDEILDAVPLVVGLCWIVARSA